MNYPKHYIKNLQLGKKMFRKSFEKIFKTLFGVGILAIFLILGFSGTAQAHHRSSFFYQAESQTQSGTLKLNYGKNTENTTDTSLTGNQGQENEQTVTTMKLDWEYGAFELHSVQVGLRYTSGKTESSFANGNAEQSATFSGLREFHTAFKGTLPYGKRFLFYVLNLEYGPGKIKLDTNGFVTNSTTGRVIMSLQAAYGYHFSFGALALDVHADLLRTDATINSPILGDLKQDGGDQSSFGLVFEQSLENWLWGLAVTRKFIAKTKLTLNGSSVSESKNPGETEIKNFYRVNINKQWMLLPALTYTIISSVQEDSTIKINDGNAIEVTLGVRANW